MERTYREPRREGVEDWAGQVLILRGNVELPLQAVDPDAGARVVGRGVGRRVGDLDGGNVVGFGVGKPVGCEDGSDMGHEEGCEVGIRVGLEDGCSVG